MYEFFGVAKGLFFFLLHLPVSSFGDAFLQIELVQHCDRLRGQPHLHLHLHPHLHPHFHPHLHPHLHCHLHRHRHQFRCRERGKIQSKNLKQKSNRICYCIVILLLQFL